MKQTTGNNIKLGIFASITIILLIVGIYFIGQRKQLFSNTFHISAVFKDIGGLQIGNNVRFSGIDVGVIEEIQQITDTTVKVDMIIDENTRKFIKKNATATISSDGLMGNKIMLIIPGAPSNKELVNNDILQTAQPVSMDEILVKLKVTSTNAADITDDLAAIMDNIRQGRGTMGKLFMDSSFAENVDQAMVNIKQGTGGFKQNMDAASHNILLRGYLKKKAKHKEEIKEEKKEKEEKEKEEKAKEKEEEKK
jgi:phospholipid/cholesterol/gamma-HCH transport system substrate-binding protein